MAEHHESTSEEMRDVSPPVTREEPTEENDAEEASILANLESDQRMLNAQAAMLEDEAKKLDETGDDEAKQYAAQMHAQASIVTSLAKEVGQAIADRGTGQSKKELRSKRKQLHVDITSVLIVVEHETEICSSMSGELTEEHKSAIHAANHTLETNESTATIAHAFKKILNPPPKKHHVHEQHKETEDTSETSHHSFVAAAKHKAKECWHHVKHYWNVAEEKAEEAGNYVWGKTKAIGGFIVEHGAVVGTFAMSALHGVGHIGSTMLHVAIHPLDTLRAIAGPALQVGANMLHNTHQMLGNVAHTMLGLWPFGGQENAETEIAVAQPKPSINMQAIHAVKKLALSKSFNHSDHRETGEMLSPNIFTGVGMLHGVAAVS